jgi:HK97 family phage prohead protease
MNNKRYAGFFAGELRASTDGNTHIIEGLACPYDKWSEPIFGHFLERFARGAFNDHLSTEPDVICTINHNPQYLTGRSSAKTLTIKERDDGVYIKNRLPNTTYVKDFLESVERGDIRGMSFIFDCQRADETWIHEGVDMPQRTINKANILEVTYTPIPAYKDTSLALRSMNLADAEYFRTLADATKKPEKQGMKTDDAIARLHKLGIRV